MTYSQQLSSTRSGVYRTPADLAGLEAEARAAGFAWADVALGTRRTKPEALVAIAEAVGAPGATFGENWDALADVLQDLSWRQAPGQVLHLRGVESLDPAVERAILFKVLRASAASWKARGKPFFALVDDAPELPEWQ